MRVESVSFCVCHLSEWHNPKKAKICIALTTIRNDWMLKTAKYKVKCAKNRNVIESNCLYFVAGFYFFVPSLLMIFHEAQNNDKINTNNATETEVEIFIHILYRRIHSKTWKTNARSMWPLCVAESNGEWTFFFSLLAQFLPNKRMANFKLLRCANELFRVTHTCQSYVFSVCSVVPNMNIGRHCCRCHRRLHCRWWRMTKGHDNKFYLPKPHYGNDQK